MTNHPNRQKIGVLRSSEGRTTPEYAVLERTKDGQYCTYMRHIDQVSLESRVATHGEYKEAMARFDRLEVDAALRR